MVTYYCSGHIKTVLITCREELSIGFSYFLFRYIAKTVPSKVQTCWCFFIVFVFPDSYKRKLYLFAASTDVAFWKLLHSDFAGALCALK